ncbi:hypothetical protein ACIQWR_16365 [Streptomyces sp. NPDC098789]|uniref:hypothetical protein n=1 Tax=Streptomyces sp. NPDC098789 TaxID=3366098 RepID=UPI00381515F1
MVDKGEVEHECVRAAWESCRALDEETSEEELRLARQEVRLMTHVHGRQELRRATVFLTDLLIGRLVAELGREERAERLDRLVVLLPPVVRRLSGLELVDPAQVPMVVGVLAAAVMDLDAVAWRDGFGGIGPAEGLHHHFVLWLLADLHDTLLDHPGAADTAVRAAIDRMEGTAA